MRVFLVQVGTNSTHKPRELYKIASFVATLTLFPHSLSKPINILTLFYVKEKKGRIMIAAPPKASAVMQLKSSHQRATDERQTF